MDSEERFDAIVIGAGASGLGAAYMLSKYGFKVLVIERGERVGSKNVYGGRIYTHAFRQVISDFTKEAPIERWVRRERLTLMSNNDALTLELSINGEYNNSFTAYLPKFLRWLSKMAEGNGALVLTGVKVDELLIEDGKVVGVLAGGDRLMADVVIDAEGANPILARGIRGDWGPHEVAVGVKEVIKLPKSIIEERLGLGEDEGLAQLFIGYPTRYLPGGGFLYTNSDSLTIGVVIKLDQAVKGKVPVYDLIEDFRQHPYLRNIVKGGTVVEYSAHLIPEAPTIDLSKLYWDGLLIVGDAAGFTLNTGFTVRGVDLAFWSGVLAAEAVKRAHDEGEFTRESLSHYERLLRESFIVKEMQAFSGFRNLLNNTSLYSNYVVSLIDFLRDMYTVNGNPRRMMSVMINSLHRHNLTLLDLVRDLALMVMTLR